MFAVCLRYCANYEEAKDILHDGFVTVFTKIGQFQHSGSFEGWVRRIFVNHALEKYRSNAKISLTDRLEEVDLYQEPDVEDEWEGYRLTEGQLLEMIDSLPPQYKMVFNMYAIDGLSHKEIGEALGIAEGTSRSNLLRARSILQKQINEFVDSMSYKEKCK
jgi:RNA polymerase sigma-70 factor (ECF subfamily)